MTLYMTTPVLGIDYLNGSHQSVSRIGFSTTSVAQHIYVLVSFMQL